MSKTKQVVETFEIDVKPVPTGNILLKDFIQSQPGKKSFVQYQNSNFTDFEKMYGFLCNYQVCEIHSAFIVAGAENALSDNDVQEQIAKFAFEIVKCNMIDILMATGGELSNLFAKTVEEVMKGGV